MHGHQIVEDGIRVRLNMLLRVKLSVHSRGVVGHQMRLTAVVGMQVLGLTQQHRMLVWPGKT